MKTIKRRKVDKSLLHSMTDEQMKEANKVSKSTRELDVQEVINNYHNDKLK